MDALAWSRFQFGFTITYHYLFPQLTMGLALLIVVFKLGALRTSDGRWHDVARFFARIFGLNFAVGVVTGVPMEFQFGTNWSRFSGYAGGVIGLTLALEGMFAFFAESAFLGLFLFGEKRLSPRAHLGAAVMLFVGSWCSGYFIIVTNAFMQHPVGARLGRSGALELANAWAYLFNPWAIWEYAHTMTAAVMTGAFVVCAVAAAWLLLGRHLDHARIALRVGVITAAAACVLQLFPTGDRHGKLVAEYQRPSLAAMEGKFASSARAELALIGQPDLPNRRLDNPIVVPGALSFLAYGSFGATVYGLDDFPRDQWPDNVELLYYSYHVMVGLGTILTAIILAALLLLWRGRLERARWLLWLLLLAWPFPYIATTAGWMTAELGRQPWLVYGLMRTADGSSPKLAGGTVAFSTIGWLGLYLVVGVAFLALVARQLARGPAVEGH
ncbi:MAG TPA: cytochrome ubiquinol oxidase subunit I [Polyangia bacterium]